MVFVLLGFEVISQIVQDWKKMSLSFSLLYFSFTQ